jgi:prepilin signal peptidase PulO-like enzyme (type II secretory pathway)
MTVLILALAAWAGLWAGSFATTALYRIPAGQRWLGENPKCQMCHHALGFYDYFPVLSYPLHRGICRYCGGAYPLRASYCFLELAYALIWTLHVAWWGVGDLTIFSIGLSCVLLVSGMAAWEHGRAYASWVMLAFVLALLYRVWVDRTVVDGLLDGCLGGVIGGALRALGLWREGKPEAMDDWRRSMPLGRWSGPDMALVGLTLIAGVIGGWLMALMGAWLPWLPWVRRRGLSVVVLYGWLGVVSYVSWWNLVL